VPGGRARRAAIVPAHERFAPPLRVLAVTEGSLTRPGARPQGCGCSWRDIDGGAGTRTHQPSQVERIAAVRVPAVPRLLRHTGGRHHPARRAFWGQGAGEPGATGACCGDQAAGLGLGGPRPHPWIAGALARADSAARDARRTGVLGGVGNREGVLGHLPSEIQRGRRGQGGPPRMEGCWCAIRPHWLW
jgi:hypothetical protein